MAKKNLKRRHLWLHKGSELEVMTVWHNVQLRPDTKPPVRSVFPCVLGNFEIIRSVLLYFRYCPDPEVILLAPRSPQKD